MASTAKLIRRTSSEISASLASEAAGEDFFNRSSTTVARALLGASLVRCVHGGVLASIITEVEVYDGFHDRASHAHRGMTPRNAAMFGPPGRWYVYLCYGMHWMLNVVTREEGYPAAILIRAVRDASGPGRVTKYFSVDGDLSGLPALPNSGMWIVPSRRPLKRTAVQVSKRIGVDYAGKDAHRLLRYSLVCSDALSPD